MRPGVHVHHVHPVFGWQIETARFSVTGIGDKHVNSTEGILGLFDERFDGLLICYIQRRGCGHRTNHLCGLGGALAV